MRPIQITNELNDLSLSIPTAPRSKSQSLMNIDNCTKENDKSASLNKIFYTGPVQEQKAKELNKINDQIATLSTLTNVRLTTVAEMTKQLGILMSAHKIKKRQLRRLRLRAKNQKSLGLSRKRRIQQIVLS